MKNSNDSANETPTDGTTNELDVSGITDAAKILIERMKTKPEEFAPGHKFGHIWAACWQRVNPTPHTGAPPPVPLRDAEVLLIAYDKYITEPEFIKHVLESVFADDTELPGAIKSNGPNRYAMGLTDPRGVYGAALATASGQQLANLGQQQLANMNAALTLQQLSLRTEMNNALMGAEHRAWVSNPQEQSE